MFSPIRGHLWLRGSEVWLFWSRREQGRGIGTLDIAPHLLMSDFHVHKHFPGSIHRSHEDLQSIGGWPAWYSSWKGLGSSLLVPVPSSASIYQEQTHFLLLFPYWWRTWACHANWGRIWRLTQKSWSEDSREIGYMDEEGIPEKSNLNF